MRLICPNCGAQYEVADDVIPVAGRDVQCSNCGHTWFERPGASEAAEAGAPLPPPTPPPTPVVDPVQAEAEPIVQPAAAAPGPDPDEFADLNIDTSPVPKDPVPIAAGAQRRGLSVDLAEMLREEATREAAARAAEAPVEPVRPSLMPPLTSDEHRDDDVRRRTAFVRTDELTAAPRPIPSAARRELLPDIEMINSSLRPNSQDDYIAATEAAIQTRKRGARFGFGTVMLIVAILIGLYLGAPRLSILVPAAAPVLTRYVAVVDDIRLWIDLRMQAFIADQSGASPATDPATAAPADAAPAADSPATAPPASEPPTPDSQAPAAPATDQSTG